MDNLTVNEYFLFTACEENSLEIVKWLLHFDSTININSYNEMAFIIACENNSLDIAKFIHKISKIDENVVYEIFLNIVCEDGYEEFILSLFDLFSSVFTNLHYLQQYELFLLACEYNNVRIAEILHEMSPIIPIHLNKNQIFLKACSNDDLEIVQLLLKIRPNSYFADIVDNKVMHYEVICYLHITNNIKSDTLDTIDTCYICYDKASLYTICRHFYCYNCLELHYINNGIQCPYCRKENLDHEIFNLI